MGGPKLCFYASPDGIRWRRTHLVEVGACDTQNVVFWDELYRSYVLYTREWVRFDDPNLNHRKVRRLESSDLVEWKEEMVVWEADEVDLSLYRNLYRPASGGLLRSVHIQVSRSGKLLCVFCPILLALEGPFAG